jgi:hypothetical protein
MKIIEWLIQYFYSKEMKEKKVDLEGMKKKNKK